MKKLIFLSTVLMMTNCAHAAERAICMVTKSTYDKLPQGVEINRATGENRIPLRIGNKQFAPEDLQNLTPKQKDILIKISNPSCCLLPYGVDSNTLRECDIEEFKKEMPSHITEKLGVYVIKEKTTAAYCCLGAVGGISCTSFVAGDIASCVVMATPTKAVWVPAGLASIGLYLGTVVGLLTLGVITLVHPCVCRDKEWYDFGSADNSDADQEEFLSD